MEAARPSAPAAEEKTKDLKQRKEKKAKTDEHRSHQHRHGHSKSSRTGDGGAAATSSAAAGGSSGSHRKRAEVEEAVGEEDWEENRAAVERLCAQYPNNICCDCGESGTRWASSNHGVFVCIRCSGVHRSLGTHISKVKSTNMDRWSLAEVRLMEAIGNAKGKTLYEARLPAGTRPAVGASSGSVADAALKSFIQRKYADREFAMHNLRDVLGRLYRDTGYGRPPKKSSKSSDALGTTSSAKHDPPLDRAAISGKRGDTMRALYGDAAEDMQRSAATRKKGGGAAAAEVAAADAAPKSTFGAFGLVNVPPLEYEARWRQTLEAFAHVESADAPNSTVEEEDDERPGEAAEKLGSTPPSSPAAEAEATVEAVEVAEKTEEVDAVANADSQ